MKTKKSIGGLVAAMVMASGFAAADANAAPGRDHRVRATCTVPMGSGVRFAGNLSALTPSCRKQALKINARVAEAEDKSNDDDDDDDDGKVQATARSIETQKAAADAAVKAARQELIDAREALPKATTPEAKKAAEEDVREEEEEYNKALDEAGALAKKLADKAQRGLNASLLKERAGVRRLEEKLKSATGKEKAELEADLVEEQQDVAEKEQLLAKSTFVESLHQYRFAAAKIGSSAEKLKGARDAALARLERARDSYDQVESRVKATVSKLRDRSQELKKTIGNIKRGAKTVKATAEIYKKKYKDLNKDVRGAVDKVKSLGNSASNIKDAIGDVFDW